MPPQSNIPFDDEYFAHSGNGQLRADRWETVSEHLQSVSATAMRFAEAFSAGQQAHATGLLHDLGKYSAQFQRRLKVRGEKSRDHWSLGALAATKLLGEFGHYAAVAILGHHVGLERLLTPEELSMNIAQGMRSAPENFTTTAAGKSLQLFKADGLNLPRIEKGFKLRHQYVADMFDARMLFSTLVDADFIETEAHFEGDTTVPRRQRLPGDDLQVVEALSAFDRYVDRFTAEQRTQLQTLREALLANCRKSGQTLPLGSFTLSAPTGTGKTLAMLGFALEHARQHALRRIILVMPFLNIIDQTACIYRQVFPVSQFGEAYVLEAHSLAGGASNPASEANSISGDDVRWPGIRRRLLAENWDAPIILTTNVQLLESMFANRPSRCRKLHRLAGSVILFDEVQTLPAKLAVPTLAALKRLSDPTGPYRSSVVFATATQPAFDSLSPRLSGLVDGSLADSAEYVWAPREIVHQHESLYAASAAKIHVQWRDQQPLPLEVLAQELAVYSQCLCVVNLKRHAIDLARLVDTLVPGVFHLSTNMCMQHRLHVLHEVIARLKSQQPVRLIATQCVEAGVDVDFPVVYRALAPLESIAQAAGRCNRNAGPSVGQFHVFSPQDLDQTGRQRRIFPPGYDAAVSATQAYLAALRCEFGDVLPEIIHSPQRLRQYFQLLYTLDGRAQAARPDETALLEAILSGNFVEVNDEYRLINQSVLNVLVPYDQQCFENLLQEATESGELTPKQIRCWIRKAGPHTVGVYRPSNASDELYTKILPIQFGHRDEERDNICSADLEWWYPTQATTSYDQLLGLQFAEPQWVL